MGLWCKRARPKPQPWKAGSGMRDDLWKPLYLHHRYPRLEKVDLSPTYITTPCTEPLSMENLSQNFQTRSSHTQPAEGKTEGLNLRSPPLFNQKYFQAVGQGNNHNDAKHRSTIS